MTKHFVVFGVLLFLAFTMGHVRVRFSALLGAVLLLVVLVGCSNAELPHRTSGLDPQGHLPQGLHPHGARCPPGQSEVWLDDIHASPWFEGCI